MQELAKVFSPHDVEEKWKEKWESDGCFDRKQSAAGEYFCILMPPPNVTGVLHMGHLLNQTLQDMFVRRARHLGKSATWIPGTDHAGISMQVKVEKELAKKGINKRAIGRSQFLEHAKAWRDKHGDVILSQLKSLGVSCDFANKVHTLDAGYSKGVLMAFVELYRRGYIYRSKKMINWCPVTLTALSDEEVIMTPQKSNLFYVRYDIVERPGEFIEIATTRPETIMGDVAIAVNPHDARYRTMIGLHCIRPLQREKIPIIADEAVDETFGTGALKITPAHDVVDFEIGQRHNLPFIDVLNPDGTMNGLAGETFVGLDRFVAREKAVDMLETSGHLVKVENLDNNIGFSERGHVPIEPRLSEQWFLRYPKVEDAKRAVAEKFIKFHPQHWEKTYLHWLDGIKDWCISRQLWWGHRIPVWYKKGADRCDSGNWHVSVDGPPDPEAWEQDEDVLDTWASSWIWPFGVFGWPDQKKMIDAQFQSFFPTDVLVTGPDIIFFWVARMIMASLEFVGGEKDCLSADDIRARIPFKNVYFTGIIRDKIGRKMSKSLGNSPDPMDLISRYGADGLRLGLLLSAPKGQDLIFKEENITLGRNFCNKLWNAFRFSHLKRDYLAYSQLTIHDFVDAINPLDMDDDDHAIMLQLIDLCLGLERQFDTFDINNAVNAMSNFFWNDYCGWYVEASKARLHARNKTVTAIHDIIMRQLLLILNPIMPFITEELWHMGGGGDVNSHSMQDVICDSGDELAQIFSHLVLKRDAITKTECAKEFVNAARRLLVRSKCGRSDVILLVLTSDDEAKRYLSQHAEKAKNMIGASDIRLTDKILQLPAEQVRWGTIFIDTLTSDTTVEKEKIRNEIATLSNLIRLNESKLSNVDFMNNAPSKVVEGAKKLLEENSSKRQSLEQILLSLEAYPQ